MTITRWWEAAEIPAEPELLVLQHILKRTSVKSRNTIYRWIREGRFPKPRRYWAPEPIGSNMSLKHGCTCIQTNKKARHRRVGEPKFMTMQKDDAPNGRLRHRDTHMNSNTNTTTIWGRTQAHNIAEAVSFLELLRPSPSSYCD
jgi:hypothetical protein